MLEQWEKVFIDHISSLVHDDASHDLGHFRRVYGTARSIGGCEGVDWEVILAAAYFHDIVSLPKNHPDNKMSSRYAAKAALEILSDLGFPEEKRGAVSHAIEAHSFSAGIEAESLEAKIVQDADRMESLGAIGVMRTFYVTGRIGRELFDRHDLYALRRPLDDKLFGLDHFYLKLFKLPGMMQTEGGRKMAGKRAEFLHSFVKELDSNIAQGGGGALVIAEVCRQAGCEGGQLFDGQDPLARHRPLESSRFVIDRLRGVEEPFISAFLSQFQGELGGAPLAGQT